MNKAKCGSYMAKVFMIVFNFFLFMIGAVLIGIGAWVVSEDFEFADLELVEEISGGDLLRSSAIFLLSVGCFTLLLAIFGFVLACTENPYFFVVYIIGLTICWLGMIIGGLLAIAFKDKVIGNIGNGLKESIWRFETHYYNIAPDGDYVVWRGAAWDRIQRKYACCGVGGYEVYDGYKFTSNITHYNGKTVNITETKQQQVPFSCCSNFGYQAKFKLEDYKDNCYLNKGGCGQRVVTTIYKSSPILVGLGVGFGMFMMFGIIFSFCLCQNPTKNL